MKEEQFTSKLMKPGLLKLLGLAWVAFQVDKRVLSLHKIDNAHSPGQAEAKAILLAVQIAKSTSWFSVIFHYDTRDLALSVNNRISLSWDYTYTLSELWSVAMYFDSWSCM